MMNKLRNKNVLIIVGVVLVGLLMVGGTYAWLLVAANVENGTYNITSDCFLIDYTDNTNQITGTLFPGSGPAKGLHGSASLKINSSCSIRGIGTLSLNINSNTASKFGEVVAAHCEDPQTLVTLEDYETNQTCTSNGGVWVTDGTALKYIIYENASFLGNPLAKGYISSSMIGSETEIYSNFLVNSVNRTFYIYLWLDGYVSDNTYTNLAFDGYIKASGLQQVNDVPTTYEPVEFIRFSGTQYVNTGVSPSMYNGNYTVEVLEKHAANSANMYLIGSGASNNNASSRANIRIDKNGVTAQAYTNTSNNSGADPITATGKLVVNNFNYIKYDVNSKTQTREFIVNGNTFSSTSAFISIATITFRIGGYNTTASYNGDIYNVRIYGNGGLVRNLVPCYRKSDNAIGFYDMVDGGFYTNSGSGTLTYG